MPFKKRYESVIYNGLAVALKKDIESYLLLNTYTRPFSDIYRIKLLFLDKSEMVVYFKIYHEKNNSVFGSIEIENEYATTLYWYEFFKKSSKFGVIKPLYVEPEKRIIVTEESLGINLGQYIFRKARFFPSDIVSRQMLSMVKTAGEWLSLFQSVHVKTQQTSITLEYLLDYINLRLNRIVDNPEITFTEYDQNLIISYIKRLWGDVTEKDKRISYVHADFSLSNILVQNEKVIVLDFNKMEAGSIFQDSSRFYHQLTLLKNKPIYQGGIIDRLTESFLTGYGNSTIWENPLFKIYLMRHRINHLGKTARYWEHGFVENIYNRRVVRNTLKEIKELVTKE